MKKMTISFVISVLLMEGLILGMAIWVFVGFSSMPDLPGIGLINIFANPYVFFPIVAVGMGWTGWVMSKNYQGAMRYFRSIEQLGLKPDMKVTAYNTLEMRKSFDTYFRGGITGEVLLPFKGAEIKIMHLYQPNSYFFFSEVQQKKIVAVFEVPFSNDKLSFRIQKSPGHGGPVKKSKMGNEYVLLPFPGYGTSSPAISEDGAEVFSQLSAGFADALDRLPGKNIIIGQSGKLRLIHDGFVDTVENIRLFADVLLSIVKLV
jgi:hypothetical protein